MAHLKARTERPEIYPRRLQVPDDLVRWSSPWGSRANGELYLSYDPPYFVAPTVLKNDATVKQGGWADPEEIKRIGHEIRSYEGPLKFDRLGRPLNPHGRTGIAGRGLLGKWGPNFAADPIVTRRNPKTGQLEMLAIKRKDSGEWAIPGGMVDEGEHTSQTLAREFKEEAGIELDMDDAVEIYRGYVDDPRNTDHAWIETTVRHKHLEPELARKLHPIAGDDAVDVKWLQLTDDHLEHLYANHAEFVQDAICRLTGRERPCWVELQTEEKAALAMLGARGPGAAQNVILFTDPNKDPDDMATYVFAKALGDRGFLNVVAVVTTLGDADIRNRRARFAKGVFSAIGMDTLVAAGREYSRDERQCREHQKFLIEQLLAEPGWLHEDSATMLREALESADDRSITLTVIAGMTDAAALFAEEPGLMRRKVGRVVIMGGIAAEPDAEGFAVPDVRAYNNATDLLAARAFYKDVQRAGIPLTVVSKEAAYRAAAPRQFYDGIRRTGHPVGLALHEIQYDALASLWDGIKENLIPQLNREWFVETFTDLAVHGPEAQSLLREDVAFDEVWSSVSKLNLYDPLTLLSATPGVGDWLFAPVDVPTPSAGGVQLIGDKEVRDPEWVRQLLSALGIVALRGQTEAGR